MNRLNFGSNVNDYEEKDLVLPRLFCSTLR